MSNTKIGIFWPGDYRSKHNATENRNEAFRAQPHASSFNCELCIL